MAVKLQGVRQNRGGYSEDIPPEYMPNVGGPLLIIGQPERQTKWDSTRREPTSEFSKWRLVVIDAHAPVAEPFSLSVLRDTNFEVGDIIAVDEVEACEIYCNNYRCLHHRKPDVYFRTAHVKKVGHIDLLNIASKAVNNKEEL